MTDAEKRTLGLLETLGTTVADMRGEQRAQHSAIDKQLTVLHADLDVVQSTQQAHGQQIAALPCSDHGRRISEMVKAVRNGKVAQTTRQQVVESIWRRTVQVFAVVGALAAAGGAVFAFLN